MIRASRRPSFDGRMIGPMPSDASRRAGRIALCLSFALPLFFAAIGGTWAQTPEQAPSFGGDLWTRSKLTGDWGGLRDQWAAKGFTIDLDATYVPQGVPSGGILGADNSLGNTLHGEVLFGLDTTKADLWPGGLFKLRLEGRWGNSALAKAGTVAPVNTDALFPDSTGNLDKSVFGLTELTYTQFLSTKFGLFGGLLNTLDGDDNVIAGGLRHDNTFFNSALLASLVALTPIPSVALGGGAVFIPMPNLTGSFTVIGSQETATRNPFDHWNGTSLATEWKYKYHLGGAPAGIVGGFAYSIDKSRADIAQDPRVFIRNIIVTQTTPTTRANTWALYTNLYQFIQGNEQKGWGPFLRAGVSDGDPNPIKWDLSVGLGGKGLIPGRVGDRWGAGYYHLGMSDIGLLAAAHVSDEDGGELFYNFALTPAIGLTLDTQWVSSARPRQDAAWILGARMRVDF